MKTVIKRWGNSAGLPLSKPLLQHLNSNIGDTVDVNLIDDGLLIRRPEQPKYSLEELLSSCTHQNMQLDAADTQWLSDMPLGREA